MTTNSASTSTLARFAQAAYAAAVLSAVIGIVRDYSVLNYSDSSREFFDLFYIGGLCSILAINVVMLDSRPPTRRLAASAVSVSLGLVTLAWLCWPGSFHGSLGNLAALFIVVVMWIVGAIASRAQLAAGFAFTARFRDGVCSGAIVLLVFVESSAALALAAGAFVSTLWMLWLTRQRRDTYFAPRAVAHKWHVVLIKMILLNIGTASMLLWALHFNGSSENPWGYSAPAVVRVSMYIFQGLAIGWVVLAVRMPTLPPTIVRCSLALSLGLLTCGVLASLLSLSVGFVVMPVAVALAQCFAMVYLHHQPSIESDP